MRPRGRARCERTRSERTRCTIVAGSARIRVTSVGRASPTSVAGSGRADRERRRMRAERERRLDRVTALLRVPREQSIDESHGILRRRGRGEGQRRRRLVGAPEAGREPIFSLEREARRSGAGRGCSRARTDPSPGRSGRRPPVRAPSTPACPASTPEIGALRDERASRARPKSVTTRRPLPRSTRTFAGVRSRWTTPRACAWARAAAIGAQSRRASSQLRAAVGEERFERLAFHELHHEHGLTAILEHVVEPHDVRVLEARERGGLALEALAKLGIVGDPRVEHLERDDAAQPLVVGTPDDAHATTAELLDGAISPCDDVRVHDPGGSAGPPRQRLKGSRRPDIDSLRGRLRAVRTGESRRVRVLPGLRRSSLARRADTRDAEGRDDPLLRPDGLDGDRRAVRIRRRCAH